MSSTPGFQNSQQAYSQAVGTSPTYWPVITNRNPTPNDIQYKTGTFWVNTTNETMYYLNSQSSLAGSLISNWVSIIGNLTEIITPVGGPVTPTSGAITFSSAGGIEIDGGTAPSSTITFTLTTPSYTDTLTTLSGMYVTITNIPVAAGTSIVLKGMMIASNAGHTNITGGDLMVVADGTAAAIVGSPVVNVEATTSGTFQAIFSGGDLLVQVQAPTPDAYDWKFIYSYTTLS